MRINLCGKINRDPCHVFTSFPQMNEQERLSTSKPHNRVRPSLMMRKDLKLLGA